MRKFVSVVAAVLMVLVALSTVARGDGISPTNDQQQSKCRFGGDERIREEAFDDIPINAPPPGLARGGHNDYFRFRTRLWNEDDLGPNTTFRIRAVNEFREWYEPQHYPSAQRSNYNFPDEVTFDTLYLDFRNLMQDKLDLRVGRQDLMYGTGKVILEGTPKDGSRTIYFNAIKATWKGVKDTTIDVFGIYNPGKDPLAINDADRDLDGQTADNADAAESGAGIYVKNKSSEQLPFEVYAIYKNEENYETPATPDPTSPTGFKAPTKAWQKLDPVNGMIDDPSLDIGTFGFRLMPVFSDRLTGNLEAAYQVGQRDTEDQHGYMVDAFLTYQVQFLKSLKPAVDYGLYYLSGDDPKTKADEGWDPLWARYPQYSELYIYGYDADGAGRWSNLSMPHAGLTFYPADWLKTTAMVGYMYAPEADGPGGGHERGWLGVVKGEFTIKEKILTKTDKLTGHLWLEVLEPGDYYSENQTGWFARWEVAYEF